MGRTEKHPAEEGCINSKPDPLAISNQNVACDVLPSDMVADKEYQLIKRDSIDIDTTGIAVPFTFHDREPLVTKELVDVETNAHQEQELDVQIVHGQENKEIKTLHQKKELDVRPQNDEQEKDEIVSKDYSSSIQQEELMEKPINYEKVRLEVVPEELGDVAKTNIHKEQELQTVHDQEAYTEIKTVDQSTCSIREKNELDVCSQYDEQEIEEIVLKDDPSSMQQEEDMGVDSNEEHTESEKLHGTLKLKVHRGRVFGELEQYFMVKQINFEQVRLEIEMLLPDGKTEPAEDNGGVMRDALYEFWSEFYEKCTDGERMKVPIISGNRNEKHWTSYAKILVLGFKQENYLPVQLAPCFMRSVISGDHTEKHKDLIPNYLLFLNQDDADVVKKAIDDFDQEDKDDILEFLSEHKITKSPSQENIEEIITQLAHKELIQAPAFVSNCWNPVLKPHIGKLLAEDIAKRFDELSPTSKKVLKALQFPDKMEVKHEKVKKYLQKYIKTCDNRKLKLLLRFCTGNIVHFLLRYEAFINY